MLTHGQASEYADAFDIDWAAGGGRLRIPVVGDDDLARRRVDRPPRGRGRAAALPRPRLPAGSRQRRRQDELGLTAQDVHARQHYELVSWRVADAGLNYRRFFAVNSLAAIRVEDREWFDRSHDEIGRWFTEGLVDGLRVDHPDGLRDPEGYLARPGRADRRRLRASSRRSSSPARSCRASGRPRAPPATTRWRSSTGCSPTPPRPSALGALDERLRGGPVDWARDGPRQQARRRRRDPALGGAAASAASCGWR